MKWIKMEFSFQLFLVYITVICVDYNSATKIPRVIAVTSTPYGATVAGASFSCLVSDKEDNSTSVIKRYVRQGADTSTYSLDLPQGHVVQTFSDQVQRVFLPVNTQSQGTFTCRIFKNGQNHDVPITLLHVNRRFEAADGKPTITVNVGERAVFVFERLDSVLLTEIYWRTLSDFSLIKMSGSSYLILSTKVSDADVYGCHVNNLLSQARLGVIRLIVRGCSPGKWGPPLCTGVCDMCYNGGICDDKTGECICPPGFNGPNCLNICEADFYGWECEFKCGVGEPLQFCAGSHICMPDPYGCSCAAGFTGIQCMDACDSNTFGAGCTEECHCAAGDCLPHSGVCVSAAFGCASGWSGTNCQIPDVCPFGYFGSSCADKCHCEDDGPCDRETGKCSSTEGNCAPGYASSTGVNLENCQQFIGCHSQCTRTCHCSGGESDCITDDLDNTQNGMCTSGMCASPWVGVNCESGIIEETASRANPGQSILVTCTMINKNMMPMEVRLSSFLRQGIPNNSTSFAIYISTDRYFSRHGVFFAFGKQDYIVSDIWPDDRLFCVHETADGMAVAEVTLNFFVLPVLSSPPTLVDSGDTWIEVMWSAWNSTSGGDVGEGPILSYQLYLKEESGDWTRMAMVLHSENITEHTWNMTGLTNNARYEIAVTVSREGEGGEGDRSSPISVTIGTPLPDTTTTEATTVVNNTPLPATTVNIGAITFGILCVILLLLICAFIAVVWRKRRDRRERHKKFEVSSYRAAEGATLNHEYGISSAVYEDDDKTTNTEEEAASGEPPTAKPVAAIKPSVQQESLRPISLDAFPDYFWSSLESGLLVQQWESLPEDLTHPCETAKKDVYKPRNRYRNILPYDYNRVVLNPGDDNMDGYINASYIKGFGGNRRFIASQGPNTASVNDFWEMIWQEDVGKIVMATNLMEEGKNKCFKYWPEVTEGEALFGSFSIQTNSEESLNCCVKRDLTVKLGKEERSVTQFHYVNWPDKNVPRDTSSVIRLLDVVQNTSSVAKGPTVIHCSAGAGRSGVLLALDIIIQQIEKAKEVDVFTCVQEMRIQRPWMVQTADQYVFLHRLIMEFLLCKNTFVERDDFAHYTCKIQELDPETGEAEMTSQFKVLEKISPTPKLDPEAAGLLPENQNKNRDPTIIPVNKYRPYLITEGTTPDSTNYINASFIDGISSASEFITTQMPLPHTIVDFWRLVYDYQIKTIVLLNNMDKKDETCLPYWGFGEPLVCGDLFRIVTTAVKKKGDIVERTLVLENLLNQTVSEVKQFQLKKWSNQEPKPASMARFAIFIKLVKEFVSESSDAGPILVHCMSGVRRSGLFCAVLSCLRQLDDHGGVDVIQIVKQLKQCQPLLIQTERDFCLVYDLVSICTSPEAVMYENVKQSSPSTEMLDSESLYENLGFKSKSLRHSGIMHADSNA